MKFETALESLRDHSKPIRRQSWHSADTQIAYMPPMTVPAGMVNGRTRRFWPANKDLNVSGYYVKIHQGKWIPGWRPSSDDLGAEDWEVVKGGAK